MLQEPKIRIPRGRGQNQLILAEARKKFPAFRRVNHFWFILAEPTQGGIQSQKPIKLSEEKKRPSHPPPDARVRHILSNVPLSLLSQRGLNYWSVFLGGGNHSQKHLLKMWVGPNVPPYLPQWPYWTPVLNTMLNIQRTFKAVFRPLERKFP